MNDRARAVGVLDGLREHGVSFELFFCTVGGVPIEFTGGYSDNIDRWQRKRCRSPCLLAATAGSVGESGSAAASRAGLRVSAETIGRWRTGAAEHTKATVYKMHTFFTVYAVAMTENVQDNRSTLSLHRISGFVLPRGLITVRMSPWYDVKTVSQRFDGLGGQQYRVASGAWTSRRGRRWALRAVGTLATESNWSRMPLSRTAARKRSAAQHFGCARISSSCADRGEVEHLKEQIASTLADIEATPDEPLAGREPRGVRVMSTFRVSSHLTVRPGNV